MLLKVLVDVLVYLDGNIRQFKLKWDRFQLSWFFSGDAGSGEGSACAQRKAGARRAACSFKHTQAVALKKPAPLCFLIIIHFVFFRSTCWTMMTQAKSHSNYIISSNQSKWITSCVVIGNILRLGESFTRSTVINNIPSVLHPRHWRWIIQLDEEGV